MINNLKLKVKKIENLVTKLSDKVSEFNDKSKHFSSFIHFFGSLSEGNSRKHFHPFSMSINNKSMKESSECDLSRNFSSKLWIVRTKVKTTKLSMNEMEESNQGRLAFVFNLIHRNLLEEFSPRAAESDFH